MDGWVLRIICRQLHYYRPCHLLHRVEAVGDVEGGVESRICGLRSVPFSDLDQWVESLNPGLIGLLLAVPWSWLCEIWKATGILEMKNI